MNTNLNREKFLTERDLETKLLFLEMIKEETQLKNNNHSRVKQILKSKLESLWKEKEQLEHNFSILIAKKFIVIDLLQKELASLKSTCNNLKKETSIEIAEKISFIHALQYNHTKAMKYLNSKQEKILNEK